MIAETRKGCVMTSSLRWTVFLLVIFAIVAPAARADEASRSTPWVSDDSFGLCGEAEAPMSRLREVDPDATAHVGEPSWLQMSHCGTEPTAGDPHCDICFSQCDDWQAWCFCICFEQGTGPGCRFSCLTGYEACAQQCEQNCTL